LPTVAAEDQRLVLELLKRHLCLEVSAIALIDLDDHIFGSQNRFHQGGVMSHVISQPLAQARVVVFEAGGCYILR
jgi:hypothetical protein